MMTILLVYVLLGLFSVATTGLRILPVRFLTTRCFSNKMDGITISSDLQPLQNNLLIKLKPAVSATSGGIFIPDNAKERPSEGIVVASGPGRVHPETGLQLNIAVQTGDGVIYGKFDGTEMKYNDANHQLIRDDDVLLKFTGSEPTFANSECVKDQVMIRLPVKDTANASGIITQTAESKEKKPDTGIVAKVGPGRQAGNGNYLVPQVEPGDGVRYRDFAGADVKLEGVDYRVVRGYDILAKWKQ